MRAIPFLALALVIVLPGATFAEDRIAYANVEVILSLMPETKTAVAGVDSLGRALSRELDMKEAYAQKRLDEARAAQAQGASEEELKKYHTELTGLQDELRKEAEAADEKLARKRAEVLQPVLQKLEDTIREVAKEEGYAFVLNSTDGDGNSIVLYGVEERDLTKKILTRMGIEVPAKLEGAGAGAEGTGAAEGGGKTPAK